MRGTVTTQRGAFRRNATGESLAQCCRGDITGGAGLGDRN